MELKGKQILSDVPSYAFCCG